MFTLDQILLAHSKVKTGADFPNYIQEIKKLGVLTYTTYVSDLHVDYFGANHFQLSKKGNSEIQFVSENTNAEKFKTDLKAHQRGETDFASFRKSCGETGIAKWIMDLEKMTCTYFDKTGNSVLEEKVPGG